MKRQHEVEILKIATFVIYKLLSFISVINKRILVMLAYFLYDFITINQVWNYCVIVALFANWYFSNRNQFIKNLRNIYLSASVLLT